MKRTTASFLQGLGGATDAKSTLIDGETKPSGAVATLIYGIQQVSDDISEISQRIEGQKTEFENAKSTASAQAEEAKALCSIAKEHIVKKAHVDAMVEELRLRVEKAKMSLASAATRCNSLAQERENKVAELNNTRVQLEQTEARRSMIVDDIAELEQAKGNVHQEISECEMNVKGRKTELDDLQRRASTMEESLNVKNERISGLRGDILALKKKVDCMKEAAERLQKGNEESSAIVEERSANIDKLHQEAAKLEREHREVEEELVNTAKREVDIRSNHELHSRRGAELTLELGRLKTALEIEERKGKEIDKEMNSLNSSIEEEAAKENDLRVQIQTIAQQNQKFTNDSVSVEAEISQKETHLNELRNQLQIMKQKLSDEKRNNASAEQQMESETARYTEQLAAKKETLAKLRERKQELEKELDREKKLSSQKPQPSSQPKAPKEPAAKERRVERPRAPPVRKPAIVPFANKRADLAQALFDDDLFSH